jgi:hypothetical protein
MHCLRPLQPADFDQVVAVYRDAVISQAQGLYTDRQIQAWADHGGRDDGVRQSFLRGYGLASCSQHDDRIIEAFALLDPPDRLALLYCRGRSHRQGRASALLDALESRARLSGCRQLRTEASQLSRPLLERRGWHVDHEEELLFAGIWFRRWRMIRELM